MIQPLPRKLYDRAIELGVREIRVEWTGGSDEGYLNISLDTGEGLDTYAALTDGQSGLHTDLENWAYDAFTYNGAGDGNDYGDNITYDLVKKRVTHDEWMMQRQDLGEEEQDLEFDEPEPEEEPEPPTAEELVMALAQTDGTGQSLQVKELIEQARNHERK